MRGRKGGGREETREGRRKRERDERSKTEENEGREFFFLLWEGS